ncbi:uncharacterized protein LOC133806208 [Humulus lupulus]|uniref:uncharacterized protein LOC133806208 n=1 Tax=Humulus lupulus TaxID=3486 RepID=UPI002B410291|nr:uncharacterized protein LOC133806208 [Humulus lupulus]
MPSYVKFMKDILSKKRRMEYYETVALTEECSAILQRKLPQKLRDPWSFTIPSTIGNFQCERALSDLGESINLMLLSVFLRLGLGEARPTIVTLQLAERLVKHSRCIIEDVLVQVEKFIFPGDFIVLDMEEDEGVPIILGRPFLAIGQALIDVQKGELKLRVQDEECSKGKPTKNPLELSLISIPEECDCIEAIEYVKWLKAVGQIYKKKYEELGQGPERPLPSIEKPPTLEMKSLPKHLRYIYLGEKETLSVIIFYSLSTMEEDKLLRVLRSHKLAIGWT